MKKCIFCLACLLYTGFTLAQAKKSIKNTVPVKEIPVIAPVPPSSGNDEQVPIVMPASDMINISATKKNGAPLRISKPEELTQLDLSQLQTLSITTRLSDKILDHKLLQQIIEEATALEFLEIDHFIIEAFPDLKTPHRHLKKLVLNYNKLKALPSSIANLTALETLHSANPLTELPASFATLKNMKELGLYNTEFSTFPAVLFGLNKLSILYISGTIKGNTKIKELPDSFQQLPELKELGITYAALAALPASIGQLKQLNKVNFSNNLFTEFPAALASNTHLEFVPFSANPLKWNEFLASVKKIKWHGLFFLNETGLSRQQYETVQQILNKTDVYYDGMND